MKNSNLIVVYIFVVFLVFFIENRSTTSDINLMSMVRKFGYPFEIYETTTEDGYILELHRVPRGKNESKNETKTKPVALIMHGMFGSSATWLITGSNRSLALTLADKGYDVWLGNNRGNTYSIKHKIKLETSYEYWNFSYHEMGVYDLPATIDYILNHTGQEKVLFNCFSQGCTQMLVMGSLKPEYNTKIEFALAFAPAAFMGHVRGILPIISPIIHLSWSLTNVVGYFPIGDANPILRMITSYFCKNGVIWQELCLLVFFSVVGFGYDEVDRANISTFFSFEPARSSWKQLNHFALGYRHKGTFRLYDYGSKMNKELYNSTNPPEYPLQNVNFPVAIYHGKNDVLANQKDVKLLAKKLPNLAKRHLVKKRKLNHYDFVFGLHTRELVYNHALQFYYKYTKKT